MQVVKCQILFSGKNKKNFNLLFAKFANRVVKFNDVIYMVLYVCVAYIGQIIYFVNTLIWHYAQAYLGLHTFHT